MNQVNKRGDVFDLVALQVTDHVPAGVGRHFGLFDLDFLHFVFSKIPDASGIGFLEIFERFGFADGDELTGRIDKDFFYCFEVGFDTHFQCVNPLLWSK